MRWRAWRCDGCWWIWRASGWRRAERAGETTLSLDEPGALLGTPIGDAQQIVEIGILMERLEEKDPDAARMVDMHYFSGFTLEEIAKETGLTFRQVRSRWERGMKWLKRMLHASARNGRRMLPGTDV